MINEMNRWLSHTHMLFITRHNADHYLITAFSFFGFISFRLSLPRSIEGIIKLEIRKIAAHFPIKTASTLEQFKGLCDQLIVDYWAWCKFGFPTRRQVAQRITLGDWL